MKIQLDTVNKIIKIEEEVNLGEFFETLEKLLPNGLWKEFKLEKTAISKWNDPIFPIPQNPFPHIPQNPFPPQTPIIPIPNPYPNPFNPPFDTPFNPPWMIADGNGLDSKPKLKNGLFNIEVSSYKS